MTAKRLDIAMGNDAAEYGFSPNSTGDSGKYNRSDSTGNGTFGGIFPTARGSWVNGMIRRESNLYYLTSVAGATLSGLGWEY